MDRNSIIGTVLIFGILFGYMFLTSPSEADKKREQFVTDSIAYVQKQAAVKAKVQQEKIASGIIDTVKIAAPDSAAMASKYGVFASAANGSKKYVTLENENLKIKISTQGGRIVDAELKGYTDNNGKPIKMLTEDSSRFSLSFAAQNKNFSTDSMFFTASSDNVKVTGNDSSGISLRVNAGNGKYLEYLYSITGKTFMLGFAINTVGLNDVIANNNNELNLRWEVNMPTQEKSIENQRNTSTIYYNTPEEGVDYLTETSDKDEKIETKTKWIAFKQQYFCSVLMADKEFASNAQIETVSDKTSKIYVKNCKSSIGIPYGHAANESFGMKMYFGPSHYNTLKTYGNNFEKLVPLGWGIFGWVNRFCVIPVFHFLDGFDLNYGLVILILTLFIKLVLFPLTYKAYLSTAKMRVLKPEMDELNAKYADDAMKKQQELMALYKKAGVSPFGGCLPMLLQMPILIALFRFFPSSIELRHQSFLWATDLSTYDSVYDFGFSIPFYGDHVSLFTLLMTVSTILYTRMNNQLTGDNPQMAQLKWMMYLMPVIFLGVFNNYSAGLSYYYFLANMITFGQQYAMRFFVDEGAIRAKIDENKKKNPGVVKKSKFQEKLEEMAKQKGITPPKK